MESCSILKSIGDEWLIVSFMKKSELDSWLQLHKCASPYEFEYVRTVQVTRSIRITIEFITRYHVRRGIFIPYDQSIYDQLLDIVSRKFNICCYSSDCYEEAIPGKDYCPLHKVF